MDPDEVLRLLRQSISYALDAQEAGDEDAEIAALREVRGYAEDMDRWLTGRGQLPERWRKGVDR